MIETRPENCEILQSMLASSVQRNGSAVVGRKLMPFTFPGHEFELELFCAVHGFVWERQNSDYLVTGNS